MYFFLTIFGFISHFIHFFFDGILQPVVVGFYTFCTFFCDFVAEAFYISIYSTWRVNIDGYFFFVILWPRPFTLVYNICASTKNPFEPVQKLFLSTGCLGRYQDTSAWVLRKVTRLRTILWSAAG